MLVGGEGTSVTPPASSTVEEEQKESEGNINNKNMTSIYVRTRDECLTTSIWFRLPIKDDDGVVETLSPLPPPNVVGPISTVIASFIYQFGGSLNDHPTKHIHRYNTASLIGNYLVKCLHPETNQRLSS